MNAAPVIHICGWPGCGKRTIARILRDRIGGRLLDNHLILDPASALFARGTPERATLRERIRDVLYDAARDLPPQIPLILTDALATTDAHTVLVERSVALARERGAPLRPFVLDIDEEENARRLTDPARRAWDKLVDPDKLRDLRRAHDILRLPGAVSIDVTALDAAEAAGRIEAHLDG